MLGSDGEPYQLAQLVAHNAYNDPSIAADLTAFDQQFGIAAPPSTAGGLPRLAFEIAYSSPEPRANHEKSTTPSARAKPDAVRF